MGCLMNSVPSSETPSELPQTTLNTYQDARSVKIFRECVERGRNLGAATISHAAQQQGATLEWLTTRDLWAIFDDRRVAISAHHGTESGLASGIEKDKVLAKELMRAAGIAVPVGRRVSSAEDAVRVQHDVGGPVVIKPVDGVMGRGVTVNVTNPDDIHSGFSRAAGTGSDVLVEQYIEVASEYRAHATSTDCVGVFRRLLPSITGDGRSTVVELIKRKNELRRHNPSTRPSPIPMDDVAESFLRRRGLRWDSVVPVGDRVVVRDVNGITSGGDSEECWDTASDLIKDAAVRAVAAVPGMDWGGVDIVVENETGTPYVIEVNTNAAINGSSFPSFGTPRDLGTVLWHRMYARSSPEPTGRPLTPRLLETPQRIGSVVSSSSLSHLTLQDMLMRVLQDQGHRIISYNKDTWYAESANNPRQWFNLVLTENDREIAVNPLRRNFLFRQILWKSGVPRPAGRRIRDIDQLQEFRKKFRAPVTLIPWRKPLGRADSKVIESGDAIDHSILDGKRNWLVQARLSGLRFSVIATPTEALVVVSPPGQDQFDATIIEEVSVLAVSAVRAVPHLRWAVVDIIRRYPNKEARARPMTLVEEMSINPTFNTTSEVVAGSMDNVFEMLVSR